jgi:hypothetical protein
MFMFEGRNWGVGLFGWTLMLAAPATPEGCAGGAGGGTGGSAPAAVCGNARVEASEDCDEANFSMNCTSLPGAKYTAGTVRCSTSCLYDVSSCIPFVCGDGKAEGWENCDGADMRGVTSCPDLGYPGGPVRCGSDCKWDVSVCEPRTCGNGKLDTELNERCEGANLGKTPTCGDVWVGYADGVLRCTDSCDYDTSACRPSICGDGVIEAWEMCEGSNMGQHTGKTCADFVYAPSILGVPTNYMSGSVFCNGCAIDTSTCVPRPGCYLAPGRFGPVPYCI